MTGGAVEKDSVSAKNDFSEWTPTGLSKCFADCTERINAFPTIYFIKTILLTEVKSSVFII